MMLRMKLEAHFKHDLDLIPLHLSIVCHLSKLLIQVDKEYNFMANYAKDSVDEFFDWKNRCQTGKPYLPVVRVAGGNHRDSAFEGALPV